MVQILYQFGEKCFSFAPKPVFSRKPPTYSL